MIAKVITHAPTREAAIAKLADALEQAEIAGVRTNNAFLIRALRQPDFIKGDIDTGFIGRHEDTLLPPPHTPDNVLAAGAQHVVSESARSDGDPWSTPDSFRLSGHSAQVVSFEVDDKRIDVPVSNASGSAATRRLANGDIAVFEKGEMFALRLYDPFEAADASGAAADRVTTPMPGKIVQILVKSGDKVKRGQPLATLEAMKMEHTLSAPADAVVASVDANAGDQVTDGTVIIRFEKAA
jgi:3-methylcrotonyl-CoA carboxylase alpha subunit